MPRELRRPRLTPVPRRSLSDAVFEQLREQIVSGVMAAGSPLPWTAIVVHLALALHYEWIHFLIHTRVQPRLGYYQRLWRDHRLHHFKNERFWYGVTRLEGDRLLGTAPVPGTVSLSPPCRDLHENAAVG